MGKEPEKDFVELVETMMGASKVKLLLTSRQMINEPSLRRIGLSEFEVEPLPNDLARNMITQSLGTDAEAVSAETLSRIVEVAQNKPLLLKGILPIVKAQIKSLEEVATDIEVKIQEEQSQTPSVVVKDESCFREMFEALTPEQQKETIRLSLFCRSFSVSDAEKLLEKSPNDTNLTLEFLNQAQIVSINDSTDKSVERSYDIHPRLQEYFRSLKSVPYYSNVFAKAEELFYRLFVEKMLKLSKLLETDFVAAYSEVEEHKPNFEQTLEIARSQSTPFLLFSDEYFSIMFEAMMNVGERREFYHSWSYIAKGKEKWLVCGQLKCREAEQVLTLEGPDKAMEVLKEAKAFLKRAKPMTTQDSYDVGQSLYLYVRGEILREKKEVEKALKKLLQSLEIRKRIFKEHVLTMRTMNEIGNCLQHLERYDEAHNYYYETKQMRNKLTGSDRHIDMPVYYNQLATVHEVKGCAKKLSAQSMKDKSQAKAMHEQANVEFKASIDWYQNALDLEVELGVSGYGNTATYHRNMANTYLHMEDYDKAFEAASKALEIRKYIFKTHPETVKSLYQVGITLEWRAFKEDKDPGLLEQALESYEEASEMLSAFPKHNRGPKDLQEQIKDQCRAVPLILQDYRQRRKGKGKTKAEAKAYLGSDEDSDSSEEILEVSGAVAAPSVSEVEGLPPAAALPQGQEMEVSVEGRTAIRRFKCCTITKEEIASRDFLGRLRPVRKEPFPAVEFYGIPFADEILGDTPVDQIVSALEPLNLPRGVLKDLKGFGDDAETFFLRIAQLLPEEQNKCFTALVGKLSDLGPGVEYCLKRLQQGEKIVRRTVGQKESQFVSRKIGIGWMELGRELVKDSIVDNIYEEVTEREFEHQTLYERCYRMLQKWLHNEGSKATVRVLMTKLTECGAGDTVGELAELLLRDRDIDC